MKASEALALDKRHEKSLVRRAKATYYGDIKNGHMIQSNPLAAGMAEEDLKTVIRMGGSGAEDAQKLLDEINSKVISDVYKIYAA